MAGEIRREPAETILGTSSDELADYYADKYSLPELRIVRGPEFEIIDEVRDVPEHERDSIYHGEGPLRNVPHKHVVINAWIDDFPDLRNFWNLNTSRFSFSHSPRDFVVNINRIGIGFEAKGYGFELKDDQIAQRVESEVAKLNQYIEWKNKDIKQGNLEVSNSAKNEIKARREALEKNDNLLRNLEKKVSIPLVKQVSTDPIQPKIKVKKAVKKLKPETNPIEQYELDQRQMTDILRFVDSFMKSLERTPGSVSKLGEEELRDLILAHLNEVFEGGATGETFSKKGKTDIYLRIDKGNILIVECKIWGGKQLLLRTVNQIRGYLTWRHNYGVVIFFSRNRNFTNVVSELKDNITKSESYISSFKKIGETHFSATHHLDDEQKQVEIHYLIYNLAI
jgi:hypothetical protein